MFMRFACLGFLALTTGTALSQNTDPSFTLKDRFISSAGIISPWANRNKMNERFYGLCYSPSLNLLNKYSDFSVAVASQLSASVHPETAKDPSTYFMYSFPAFLQFNFGHLATRNFYSSAGIFFGAGYNFSVTQSGFDMGPLLITAIRFWFLRQSFTLGYAQTHFQNRPVLLHQISLQLNIGAYLRDARNNNKISKFVKPFRK
jgi:hypothetical protein